IRNNLHNFLSTTFLGDNFLQDNMPQWKNNNNDLFFNLKNGKKCYFHFISNNDNDNEAKVVVDGGVNFYGGGKCAGYSDLGLGGQPFFCITEKRDQATRLIQNDDTFIDNESFDAFAFPHDAPTYWGMSGGPIFYIDKDDEEDFHVFGVVKSSIKGSYCEGSFLQRSIL